MRKEIEESDENETHVLSFRGLWMPESIIGAFLSQKINATEAMLLAIIDGFSKAGKCYASNGYLAKRMGCKNRSIQLMLANLENAGLLRKIQRRDGSRFLQTVAGISKFDEDGDFDDTDTPMTAASLGTNAPAQRSAKRTDVPAQNLARRGAKSCAHNSKVNNKESNSLGELLEEDQTARTSPARQLARRLKEGLSGAQKLKAKVNLTAWEAEFQKLLDSVEFEEIDAAIIWLLENIEDKFTPQAYSAASFRAKFDRISSAAARNRKETIPELPKDVPLSKMAEEAVNSLRDSVLPDLRRPEKQRGFTHIKRWCMGAAEDVYLHAPMALAVRDALARYLKSRTILCDYARQLDSKTQISDLLPQEKFKEFLKRTWRGDGISDAATKSLLLICEKAQNT